MAEITCETGASVERLRLFVAIAVPEAVRAELERVQARLRAALAGPAFRWTRAEQLHLTLKFLGSVEQAQVPVLQKRLAEACRHSPPVRLEAAGLGCFPSAKRPRVLWAGLLDPAGLLPALNEAVESASAPFSEEEPEGHFSAHITLARIKEAGRAEAEALSRGVAPFSQRSFGGWTARAVELFQSQLSPKGARHVRLFEAPLAG